MNIDSYNDSLRIFDSYGVHLDISHYGIFFGGNSLNTNGYNRLNNNLILQWGTVQASSLGYTTVTFPITFNTLFSVVKSSAYKGSDSSGEERYISWQNNAQFRTGYDTGGFNWIAIGI